MTKQQNILLIGGGGREHAMALKIAQSNLTGEFYCNQNNPAIAKIAKIVEINSKEPNEIINFCQNKKIDLVVIGPEQPLVEGLVDHLEKAGIKAFGPSKKAAQLEGSKIFTKEICNKYQIPTAQYQSFNDAQMAKKYLEEINFPCVVKADGIAAGKGVIIAQDKNEASNAIDKIFAGKFGNAGNSIVIEEFLEGPEVSFFAICDGKTALPIGSAGDHKKIGENETGLNTGGMGTYSPSPFIDENLHQKIMHQIINPTINAMENLGAPFIGILFAGLILTKDGPKLLEFNTRFGDPEAQVLLPRLQSDFVALINAAISRKLSSQQVEFSKKSAVCVVMVNKGYPEKYEKGSAINNLDEAKNSDEEITIFHAGTKEEDGKIIAVGGRVIGVCALGSNIALAREKSYKTVDKINWPNGYFRRDIAAKAVEKNDS